MSKANKKATTELLEWVDKQQYTTDDLEKIKSLLVEGADPNFCQKEYPNESVLHRIISSWDDKIRLETVKLFLEYGVDFNTTSDIFYPIDLAVNKDDSVLVQFMLENGANQGLDYALKSAIERNNIDLVTLLLSYPIDMNVFEPYAKSYLTFCCEAYRIRDPNIEYATQPGLATAQLLINHGVNPNGIDDDATPILEAIRYNFYELIDLLLDNKAVISPKISASGWVNTVEMFQYLVKKGIIKDFNELTDFKEQTAIIYHSMNANIAIVKYLIQQGADLYHKDKGNKTAFHHALYTDDLEFIDDLLNYYDVKKCHEISSVFEAVENKKIIKKLKEILKKTV